MKVKDVMNPVQDFLTPDNTLQEAVIKLRSAKRSHGLGVKGLIVLDGQENLVGVLSIKDILRATIPVYLDPKIAMFSWDGMLEAMAKRVACKKVKDYMTTHVITVSAETALMTCVDLFITKNMQRLPVIDKEKKVVGIVYIREIYNVISQIFIDQAECER